MCWSNLQVLDDPNLPTQKYGKPYVIRTHTGASFLTRHTHCRVLASGYKQFKPPRVSSSAPLFQFSAKCTSVQAYNLRIHHWFLSIATHQFYICFAAIRNSTLHAARAAITGKVFSHVHMQDSRTTHCSGARLETVASDRSGLLVLCVSIGKQFVCSTS